MAKGQVNNQKDVVEANLKDHAVTRMTTATEVIKTPGIETLHLKSVEEIGETIANIIKSRAGVTAITYTLGHSIQVTSQSNLAINMD
jgi:hypothetical protein